MEIIICFFIFVLGASIGSFINVIVWRMPIKESIIIPRSYCPNCKNKIFWFDNIPLLSFLLLKGKCRKCNGQININYFLTELFTALIFVLIYFSENKIYLELTHLNYVFLSFVVFSLFIIQLILDIKYFWLPASINYIGIALASIFTITYSLLFGSNLFLDHLFAGLLGLAIFFAISSIGKIIYKKQVIGLGDLKLIFMIGLWMGLKPILITIYLSFVSAGIISILLIFQKKINRKSFIPFGPFIIVSSSLVWLFGVDVFKNLYLSSFENVFN